MFYSPKAWRKKKECKICGKKSVTISESIGVCAECLKSDSSSVRLALETHKATRSKFGLPGEPPRDPKGVRCGLCAVDCRIPEGGKGFCGLVENRGGRIVRLGGTPDRGVLEWYYDPLPTNCVAEWFCPGCTGLGYPKYALSPTAEYGYSNLAVFYGACNLDCLFCQNWHYRSLAAKASPIVSARDLASKVTEKVTCICYFGGDPGPQAPHALATSREAVKRRTRILRICWETNGHWNPAVLKAAARLSLDTGGIMKFDLKAWTPAIYQALTGVPPTRVYDNVKLVVEMARERPEVPLFTASTLLVPGYVDEEEVRMIARFLASLDPGIPYSLLAFHPDYVMHDLPPTSKRHAEEALRAAREEGLEKVNIGNVWLLSNYY